MERYLRDKYKLYIVKPTRRYLARVKNIVQTQLSRKHRTFVVEKKALNRQIDLLRLSSLTARRRKMVNFRFSKMLDKDNGWQLLLVNLTTFLTT